jgi:hypothetical protein
MQTMDFLLESLRGFAAQAADLLPKLLLAFVILLVGWLLARLVRALFGRALHAMNFQILTQRAGVDAFLARGGVPLDATGLLAALAYWMVLLGSLLLASNGLGLTYVADIVERIVMFIPNAIVAVLIIAVGAYFARLVGDSVAAYCRNVQIPDADLLGRLAKAAILVFVVLISLDHAGIGGSVLRQSFLIILGGVVLALALAFGLGGRRWAAALLERWWPAER